jgi:hypothetical protein
VAEVFEDRAAHELARGEQKRAGESKIRANNSAGESRREQEKSNQQRGREQERAE